MAKKIWMSLVRFYSFDGGDLPPKSVQDFECLLHLQAVALRRPWSYHSMKVPYADGMHMSDFVTFI